MSSKNHSFSPFVAAIVGVKKAVVLQHFEFLQESFITEKVPIKKVWVRRSVKALTTTYPYMSPKEIRGCLDGLVKDGYLDTIVNNGSSTDHTKSYQLTEKGWILIGQPKPPSDLPAGAKGLPVGANRLHKRANPNIVSSNQFIINTTTTEGEIDAAAATDFLVKSTTEDEGVTMAEMVSVKAEKEKDTPSSAAPLEKEKELPARPTPGESAPRRWDAFDIDKEAEVMKVDFRVCEKFAKDLRMSLEDASAKLPLSIDEFVSDQKAVTYNYQNQMQMRRHYFNWILTAPAAKAAANKQRNGASQSPARVTVSTPQTQTRY